MNEKLVIVGGGGHARSVIDSALSRDTYSEIVIVDPAMNIGDHLLGCQVVGSDDELPHLYEQGFGFAFIGVGSIESTVIRRKLENELSDIGYELPVITDATAVLATDCKLAQGVYVGKKAVINSGASISCNAIINTGAIIEHECSIGEYSHISVGAVVCGGCVIGKDVLIGANATIIQCVNVGDGAIIGAGSIVLSDVPPHTKVTGVWHQ